jgi:hypothetical protein
MVGMRQESDSLGLVEVPADKIWGAQTQRSLVVSMIPGVFLFRMSSGLLQIADGSHTTLQLLSSTIADGMTATLIILAMSFGLIVPKLVIDWISECWP